MIQISKETAEVLLESAYDSLNCLTTQDPKNPMIIDVNKVIGDLESAMERCE